jgi:VanZ family protein
MRRTLDVVWLWAPVVVWLGVIALTSGEIGAHANSDVWVWRTFHEWLPRLFGLEASSSAPTFLPTWVRKSAHVAEYAVLGALAARAIHLPGGSTRTSSSVGPRRLAGLRGLPAVGVIGLPFCGAVAILDEMHQSALASRTGSPRDVLYDVLGAGLGLVVGWLVWRRGG